MRKFILVVAGIVVFVLIECAARQRPERVGYVFPSQMKEDVKAQFIKLCDKGQVLYEINCAKCHNTIVKRRQIIPDFSPEQIKGYEIRVSNAMHEENMPEELVSPEELSLIATFLTYKEKSGVSVIR